MRAWLSSVFVASALATSLLPSSPALACGCLAPPDPAHPVVQAGERILFHAKNGQITAHIQIQYSGDAADFGWLLPLPSVPTLEIGSDELFASLQGKTAPYYVVQTVYPQNCNWPQSPPGAGGGADLGAVFGGADMGMAGGTPSPLVLQDSVGPYDYAVLKADDKTAMLDWLSKNRYFVPVGTDGVVAPYIHPGAYFLALKLKSGQSTGDIAPVVVKYASDLPMIPLILTSVTTASVLDVTAWVVGAGRAIPRNYHHVVLDDAALAWDTPLFGDGTQLPRNYAEQARAAVSEVKGGHAFLTEMAAPLSDADPIVNKSIFSLPEQLARTTDANEFLTAMRFAGIRFTTPVVTLLQKYIKQPADLKDIRGTKPSPANYYYNFDFWYGRYPQYFNGFDLSFDAAALAKELDALVIKPLRDASALFANGSWITRLYTRISATDMNSDPVFSFNPTLPEVKRGHSAVREMHCNTQPWTYYGRLTTEQGYVIDDRVRGQLPKLPAASRVEILREDGKPEVVTDNTDAIKRLIPAPPVDVILAGPDAIGKDVTGWGCSVGSAAPAQGGSGRTLPLGLGALALLAMLWGARRRR